MPSSLAVAAIEKSTYIITASFTDEDGNAVAPDTLTWTLTDSGGTVINSREDVVVSSPSSTETIVLKGDDLKRTGSSDTGTRILTVEATYTSSAGSGLPLKDTVWFVVKDLVAVS